jgi:hypothetical protein
MGPYPTSSGPRKKGRLLHNAQCPEAGGRWLGYALFQQIVSDVVDEFRLVIGDVLLGFLTPASWKQPASWHERVDPSAPLATSTTERSTTCQWWGLFSEMPALELPGPFTVLDKFHIVNEAYKYWSKARLLEKRTTQSVLGAVKTGKLCASKPKHRASHSSPNGHQGNHQDPRKGFTLWRKTVGVFTVVLEMI